jgi:hypothetical protein
MKALDITGQRFGKLIAIQKAGSYKSPSRKHVLWECKCDCGGEVITRLNALRTGTVNSCGCLRGKKSFKHGLIGTSEYTCWSRMKDRCFNPKSLDYPNYGGRGITVCDEWKKSFTKFFEHMGKKPSVRHSIDRINCDGNYEPENCRWATPLEQSRNRRNTKYYKGASNNGT